MLIHEINRSFICAWKEYCKDHGVNSVPYWKLDMPAKFPDFSQEALRSDIAGLLVSRDFDESAVPAFFLFLQTQASDFNSFLWAGTTAPLLAPQHGDAWNLQGRLNEPFFRDALYAWFCNYRRLPSDRSGFWYVRTVISECGLCSAAAALGQSFYEKMFIAGLQSDELARERTEIILNEVMSRASDLNANQEAAVLSLSSFFIETGLRAASIARFFTQQTPPPEGWTMAGLLERARRVLNLSLAGLPRQALFLIESYIARQFQKVTLSQVLAMFRTYPVCEVTTGVGPWRPNAGIPLPVAHGQYRVTGGDWHRAIFVDDLYRGPDELESIAPNSKMRSTGALRWRVDDKSFSVNHSNALRAAARPVLSGFGDSEPVAWVWTGPADALSSAQFTSATRTYRRLGGSTTASILLRVWGWPTLDSDILPAQYVKRYFADDPSRVQLHYETAGVPPRDFPPSNGGEWTTVKQLLPAAAGEPAVFTLRNNTGGVVDSQKRAWPLPALYARRMRLDPGAYPRLTSSDELILVATRKPEVEGDDVSINEIPLLEGQAERLGGAARFRIKIAPAGRLTRLAADGSIWKFANATVPSLRINLVHASEYRLDTFHFRIVPDPLYFSFLSLPDLCLQFQFAPGSEPSDETLRVLINELTFHSGIAGAEAAYQSFQGSALVSDAVIERKPGRTLVILPLASVLPLSLSEPGFTVKRIALNVWNSEQIDEGTEPLDLWGLAVEFVILPYSNARSISQTPTDAGGILLTDTTNVFEPLMLAAQGITGLPALSDANLHRVGVSGRLPGARDWALETNADISRLGVWYTGALQISGEDRHIDLRSLATLLSGREAPFLVFPSATPTQIVASLESGDEILGRSPLEINNPGAHLLIDVLPLPKNDSGALKSWLKRKDSRLRFSCEGRDVGAVDFNHRPVVEWWDVTSGIPNAAGRTTIKVLVCGSAFPNLQTLKIRMTGPAEKVDESIESWGKSARAEYRAAVEWNRDVFQSGKYQIELLDDNDTKIVSRTLDVGTAVIAEASSSLDAFLDVPPEAADWTPDTTSHLFRALRTAAEPWKNSQLFCLVADLLDKISTEPVRLPLKILHAYLSAHPNAPPELFPEQFPIDVLPDVGTYWLYFQRMRAPAVRLCLREWENSFRVAALDIQRSEKERLWLEILSKGAQALQSGITLPAARSTQPTCDYVPCRPEFSAWLHSLT